MAVATFARRFQRRHAQLFHSFIRNALIPPKHVSNNGNIITRSFFTQAFHQTPFLHYNASPPTPPFDTPLASKSCILYEVIDFNQYINDTHKPTQSDVHKLSELLKNVDGFPSEEDKAIAFLDDSGVKPNASLICLMICGFKEEWKLSYLLFKWGEKWGCNDVKNYSLIVWVLGNHKKFNTAWCLIRDLHRSTYDTRQAMLIMIDRYAAANDPHKAIEAFKIMEKFSLSPDLKAFYTLLNALCKNGNIEEAEEFMLLNKKLFPLETEGFNIILNGWCNISPDLFEARRVWREMSKCCVLPNETTYTHMVSCFSKVGNLFDSLRLYDEMKKKDWVPGLQVYNSLVYVLTHENCLKEALKIVDKMKELGVRPDSATYNSMIYPLCKAAKLEEARAVLSAMIGDNLSPTIETYHAFLECASLAGTLEVLDNMKRFNLGPSKVTFLSLLGRFFKTQQPEHALKIWGAMKQYDVVPDSTHYIVLIEGLAMCGCLSKAREFYAEMIEAGMRDDPKLKKLIQVQGRNDNHKRVGQKRMRSKRHMKRSSAKVMGKSE